MRAALMIRLRYGLRSLRVTFSRVPCDECILRQEALRREMRQELAAAGGVAR